PARVAQRPLRRRVPPPERCRRRRAVRAHLLLVPRAARARPPPRCHQRGRRGIGERGREEVAGRGGRGRGGCRGRVRRRRGVRRVGTAVRTMQRRAIPLVRGEMRVVPQGRGGDPLVACSSPGLVVCITSVRQIRDIMAPRTRRRRVIHGNQPAQIDARRLLRGREHIGDERGERWQRAVDVRVGVVRRRGWGGGCWATVHAVVRVRAVM
ncbi:unnamed protein product, partial [Mycena citricolor]